MTEPGKTVGRASCILCGLANQPVKVSKKGHLYFTCAPAADGGCEHQMFARGAASDRLLAQKISKWSSQEDKRKWLGSQQPDPDPDPEELEEEIQEAIEDGAIEVSPEPAPLPPPAAPARRKARQASPSAPLVAKKKRPLPDFTKFKKEKSWAPF